ncbi:hypothetical protein MTBBW1_2360015 [Desulfamplus magnetovallimortis]|uniref:Transposase n=1 Tax=Desulfamplus magnetovallimortis TaxID=1246637 RepID=A0A1W1HE23_9BACT|nr:Rpn family recombination-promoting nuclease/putative transposase [Desulfamplus magnetovallimortis]SLM30632.1 hypothetical protein MTBBW1_2360015 [Desulfamplus magnetovallimortis]
MKIKLYNDIVFKWVFGREKETGPLLSLLNAATNSPKRFSDVQILNPFDATRPYKNEKQGILDIRGRESNTKEWFDLEVQVIVSDIFPQRSKYYLAGMYRDQLEKSSDANYDQLKPCYGIHFLVETLFDSKEDAPFWYNHFSMLNTRSYKPLADHWHLYYIELKKFMTCFRIEHLINQPMNLKSGAITSPTTRIIEHLWIAESAITMPSGRYTKCFRHSQKMSIYGSSIAFRKSLYVFSVPNGHCLEKPERKKRLL